MNLRLTSLTAITAAGFLAPALAHHSFAMYDFDRAVTVQGTVQEFEYINPHSSLRLLVKDERTGRSVLWTLELGAPAQLSESGIYANSMKPGDVVSMTFHPRKDGARSGVVVRGTLAGTTYQNR
jgi:hypothetical protein